MDVIREKLAQSEERYMAVQAELAQPNVADDLTRYAALGRESSEVGEIVERYRKLKTLDADLEKLEEDKKSLDDEELLTFVREEIERVTADRDALIEKIKLILIPPDPMDGKNIILEIRAGAGGDEASIFGGDLLRMYKRYAEAMRWKIEVLDIHELGLGGIKEVAMSVRGKNVYSFLKYESGVHRVQRVPVTESGGRIHTSTVTVAVLPEAEEVDIKIDEKDLRIDTYRASGAGGQHVNKTSSAIRITHAPTGIVVSCQDERSQLQNKERAMRMLRAHLMQMEHDRQFEQIDNKRRLQVGSGERNEKIRTYNYPQNRITDHRISESMHNLAEFMNGDIGGLIDKLRAAEAAAYFS
jgi:peptide chain release factor 1